MVLRTSRLSWTGIQCCQWRWNNRARVNKLSSAILHPGRLPAADPQACGDARKEVYLQAIVNVPEVDGQEWSTRSWLWFVDLNQTFAVGVPVWFACWSCCSKAETHQEKTDRLAYSIGTDIEPQTIRSKWSGEVWFCSFRFRNWRGMVKFKWIGPNYQFKIILN